MRYYFLREDLCVVEITVDNLRRKVKELGKEQGEAARQSTENFGHDDACQETVYNERCLAISRLKELQQVLCNATLATPEGPFDKVRLGAVVELDDGRTLRIGSFMVVTDNPIQNISYASPLAQVLMGRAPGDEVNFRGKTFIIKQIS